MVLGRRRAGFGRRWVPDQGRIPPGVVRGRPPRTAECPRHRICRWPVVPPWDPQLEERVGEAVGAELRAAGANLTGAVSASMCCATRPGDGRRKPMARPPTMSANWGQRCPAASSVT
ncbi:hypothetical protein BN381_150019 [Candidatus Microthrix parvicella RN1]|uniref:Uncharacterized protein n=1 Tax=Candidatus Neomicrothrix parvicella RN1 TaxID=1229780 RepID=R4Z0V4_9ACTN|nr:hypothetical protein BN381_150019 [Candidatus Microthrix parvicella RN1]